MSVVIAPNLVRTKDWRNPRTGQMERIITYPGGRKEVIPLGNTDVVKTVEQK